MKNPIRPIVRLEGVFFIAVTLALLIGPSRTHALPQAGVQGPPPATTPSARRVVAAGRRYQAGSLHRFFLGAGYRSLWTAPIDVEVLDLETFAGGMTPVKKGGGKQTHSLRFLTFECAQRREWKFRSIDKDLSPVLADDLQSTFIDALVQDQVSSAHPLGLLMVDPLARAVGILGVPHRLVFLPDQERLGRFRGEFAGTLGFLEEKARTEDPVTPGFEGFHPLLDTVDLWQRLDGHPDESVDAQAFLRARLFDLVINDFDRHKDQWRWARRNGSQLWEPVPEDRDQAFVRYSGVALSLIRPSQPRLVNFGSDYGSIFGLTFQGRFLDRRHLAGLEWSQWLEAVECIQTSLTDRAIDTAIDRLPVAYRQITSGRTATELKSRVRRLPEAARRFYEQLAEDVELHLSDKAERVHVTPAGDSTIQVAVTGPHGDRVFVRRFDPRETKSVRVYLKGGDDQVVREAGTRALTLRIIGGEGNDVLDDSKSGTTRFYDDRGENRVLAGAGTWESHRPYAQSIDAAGNPGRDWGRQSLYRPWVSAGGDLGVFLGVERGVTTYAFRHTPYARKQVFRAGYSTGLAALRGDYRGEFVRENGTARVLLHARASELDLIRFYGFGNETTSGPSEQFFEVRQRQFSFSPQYQFGPRSLTVKIGVLAQYTKEPPRISFAAATRPYGFGGFGKVGPRVDIEAGHEENAFTGRRGGRVQAGGSFFPRVWTVNRSFGEVHGEAAGFLRAAIPLRPTLSLRVGGKRVFGRYPFQEAAFLGGSDTLRGLRPQRYAGDASAYGSAELRLRLGRMNLLLPSDVGIFGLADAGRVFLDREISDRWHTAVGGGLWVAVLRPGNTMSVAFARSEGVTRLYFRTGLTF